MSQPPPDEILELAREQIATRRAARQAANDDATARRDRRWGFAFLLLLSALLLAFVLWPGASLEWKLYATVHGLVAQKHLVFLGERPLPLCARNLGLYSSFLLTLGYLWARGNSRAAALPARSLLVFLGLGALTMVFDGVNSVLEDTGRAYLYLPRNDLRTITGTLFGIALTPIILLVFNQSLRADPEPERPVLGWRDLGGLLVLNGLFVALAHSGFALLYWPLALFGVAGIIGELFTMFVLVAAVALGYSRRVTRLTQLGRPACVALLPTIIFAGGLALLRFAGEGG
jgi:hypothetical protein